MKIIVIIPSRYNSSRFEGKPLKTIGNGKPMIQCVYERVLKSRRVDDIYVATDDKRIYDTVIGFNGKALMTSKFNFSGTDRVAEAINYIDVKEEDIVINVQGDQPLVNFKCFDDLIDPFLNNKHIEMTTLAFPIRNITENENPKDVKVVFDSKGYALYFSRSTIPYARDIDINYPIYKHLGLYAYRKKFLELFHKLSPGKLEQIEKLEQLRPMEHGYQIFVSITKYDSPEVDIPEDIVQINKKII